MAKPLIQLICNTRVHCKTCRDPNSVAWRESLAKHYAVPADWPNCPEGFAMGLETQPPPPDVKRANPSAEPMPYFDWPEKYREYSEKRHAGDAGIGDMYARKYNPLGVGDFYKWFWEAVNWPCNCERDQANLNAKYPFDGKLGRPAFISVVNLGSPPAKE